MKLLMTGDALGGVWTYTLELARSLRTHGIDTALAVMGGRLSTQQRREARRAGIVDLFANDVGLEWMRERWGELEEAGEWLLDVRTTVEPDLVHLNGYVHATLPWETPVVVVAHSCVYSWFEAVRGRRPPLEWEPYHAAVRRGLETADVVVAPTRAMLRALERQYAFRTPRVVIHNARAPVAARTKEPFVLAAGRAWDEAKNLAALERVSRRLPWDVRIVGPGSDRGPVDRIALDDLFGRASIYCAPARYEPFGLGALEAAHAGCALVLGHIESQREVWGAAAAYVDTDDDAALAAQLLELIEDERARNELARRAHVRARRYTPTAMAGQYAAVYAALCERTLEEVA
jgi:glycogen(starch) synthase